MIGSSVRYRAKRRAEELPMRIRARHQLLADHTLPGDGVV